jgi:uncharacterized protein (DUF2141 family)
MRLTPTSTKSSLRGPRRRLVVSVSLVTAAVALTLAAGARAEGTKITITRPANGAVINATTPSFSGTMGYETLEPNEEPFTREAGWENRVIVKVYAGSFVPLLGVPIATSTMALPQFHPEWSVPPTTTALEPGVYTAEAEMFEEEPGVEQGPHVLSAPVTFTVDTTRPTVSIRAPANGSSTTSSSETVAGSADTGPRSLSSVTVQLYSGSSIGSQAPLESNTVQASGGSWSVTFGGLSPGSYTARAEQSDEAGNVGTSDPVTFTVTTPPPPPPPAPPTATFKWFPATPIVGQPVSLVSSSTDEASPITAFAWSFTSNGLFTPGKQLLSTSFSTAGNHIVRLRVTAADGLSSIATETIPVIVAPLTLMAPFPVVRIAGNVTPYGVNLSLLTVQAPVGARVKVSCHGRGCPTRSESRLAASSSKKHRSSTVVIAFRRFQASLGAGAVLEIRIFKQGLIGKYTRFVIRRGSLPVRVDTCIGQTGLKPIACPSS